MPKRISKLQANASNAKRRTVEASSDDEDLDPELVNGNPLDKIVVRFFYF